MLLLPDSHLAAVVRLAVTIGLVLGATGCGSDPGRDAPETFPTPRVGGYLHLAQIAPSSLDPALVFDSYDAAIVNQMHAGLLRHDSNFGLRPDVARAWTIHDDGRLYRFDLREDARFHDGTPVTAEDVAHSLRRVFTLDPQRTELARQYLGAIDGAEAFARGEVDSIAGLVVRGPHVVEIRLESPYAPFLDVLASEFARIVPRTTGDHEETTLGCGPFALREWAHGQRLVLDRHEGFHGTRPPLDGLVVHTPPEPVLPHARAMFDEGTLHLFELTGTDAAVASELRDVTIHRRRELSLTFLAFSIDRPLVRRAIAHAIDPRSLSGVGATDRPVANGVLPPGFPGYDPADKRLGFSIPLAESLLVEAGYPEGAGLDPLVLGIADRGPHQQRFARDLHDRLEAIGIDVELELVDWDTFDRGLRTAHFDLFVLTWVADLPDPDSFFRPLFHSRGGVNHHLGYADVDVDAWLDAARRDPDRTRRAEAYRKTERRVLTDAAIVPLHFNSTSFAVHRAVHGFELASMGGAQLPLRSVWLDEAASEVAR